MKAKLIPSVYFVIFLLAIQSLYFLLLSIGLFMDDGNPVIAILILSLTFLELGIIYLAIKRKKKFIPFMNGFLTLNLIGSIVTLNFINIIIFTITIYKTAKSEKIKSIFVN